MGTVVVDFDCLFRAVHFTRTGKTGLAGVCREIFCFDTAVTGIVKESEHWPGRLFPSQSVFCVIGKAFFVINIFYRESHAGKDTGTDDFAVVIDTASDRRASLGNHFFGNIVNFFFEFAF